ncbi:sensor histidine kinase [Actinacidiphila epipremni]|uniref:sensor histidine kinase n=1 Tax=Actinacidiphila epipremni TaxID=2053013 RepID=UPI002AFF2454|nr:HAMP domain-containing sensor histidine kinase [Actinacidiphila epipremni]
MRVPAVLRHARRRGWLPRTLRARLICGLVVLLALSCAAVGIAAVLTLSSYLTGQIDEQLAAAGGRFPASLEHRRRGGPGGSDRYADTRRQAPGTFGARLLHGAVTDAAVVRSGADTHVALSAADRAALAALPDDGKARRLSLSELGDYRAVAVPGDSGDVLVTGLPLARVEAAARRLVIVEAVVFGVALAGAGTAGAVWVRWSLRPLGRVAATAASVTATPLASGAVALPARVPAADTDPRTEVGRVGAALNVMLGHVEDALGRRQRSEERLRRFAADASHELRTPVAAVRGYAELALRQPEPVPAGVRRALERIGAESGRMGAMVDDLLLLARLDEGAPPVREPVDLTLLVLDAVEDARAAGPDHHWRLDLPEEPVTVPGDGPRLHQVLANLLANARAHTPPGTHVTASLRREPGGGARIVVADDGPGVPESVRDVVFERFTRAAPPPQPPQPSPGGTGAAPARPDVDAAGGGAGLGLAIVAAVVAAHDGALTLDSHPGATTFTVTLPAG